MSEIYTGASEQVSADAPDATPGKVMAQLTLYETPLGAMAIEGCHVGEFDPNIQQHRLLQLIMDEILPQLVQPAAFGAAEQTHESTETPQ